MLQVHIEDSVALMVLDHEERGNSFGSSEAAVLLKTLKNKSLKGLVMTGTGTRFFCTGGNLAEQAESGAKKAYAAQERVRKALDELSAWPRPTVALVNGDCFGGGTELLSAFDLVLAAPHALFGFWQRKLGLTYGWGGGARLLRRLTPQALSVRSLDTRLVTATEAQRIGLVDGLIRLDAKYERAVAWIFETGALPAFSEMKSWSARNESAVFKRLWMNPSHKATVAKHAKKK